MHFPLALYRIFKCALRFKYVKGIVDVACVLFGIAAPGFSGHQPWQLIVEYYVERRF